MIASWLGQSVVVAKLLTINCGAINDQDNEKHSALSRMGNTALILAADTGRDAVVNVLLRANANVDIQNKSGDTALLRTVANNHLAVVKSLLKKDANIRIKDKKRERALSVAKAAGFTDVVKVLSEYKDQQGILGLF